MSNIRKDLKKFGANPGLATPKNPEAIAALTEDIEVWPTLNADGVTWDGNFVFKAGTSFFKVYMPKTRKKQASKVAVLLMRMVLKINLKEFTQELIKKQ